MLDADTKRRIDTCRNILVGKVPDPKSQVEQITIALIYKFMDDMDAEAEELGGKRTFFSSDYARFGWAKLMAPSLGGFEVLALYSEAISTMNANPGVPELFRDIFKNAYLPYRDPETLKSFLKEINHFSYDHSERLGDAFEYLLSVLGSQGDAGQFRTPRHIIDFMVAVLDPKKDESILDPACGTAGFLISAWKHILKNNSSARSGKGGAAPGDRLTLDERNRLAANIKGYDISPDMVRLSLVNLYLHGFAEPHVLEYDTLTQDDKWNEVADVILANPPFMSPKGGIKPHKRFSVQSSRSEVLFVDYMAEHLSATGRAAIVVPEGIIFQSGTAYKALRKMLVDTSLVAVVSLPAGVFNPYSGVKTSILLLDKRVHKQTEQVFFVKVQSDGYNLGAQRRAVAANDLPEAQRLLRGWLDAPQSSTMESGLAQAVARSRIAESGDFNLSGERYLIAAVQPSRFAAVDIGDLITTLTAPLKIQKPDYAGHGRFPIIDQSKEAIAGWTDDERALIYPSKSLVIFGDHTCAVKLMSQPFAQGADGIKILETNDALVPLFLFYYLQAYPLESDGYKRHFGDLKRKTIPLPPLEVQQQIVAEIEAYQKIIDGARQVVEHYKPHIAIDPAWPVVALGAVASTYSGGTPSKSQSEYWDGCIPWVSPKDMKADFLEDTEDHISEVAVSQSTTRLVEAGTLLCVVRSGILQHTFPVALTRRAMCFNQDIVAIRPTIDELDIRYLFYVFRSQEREILADGIKPGVTVQSFHSGYFKTYPLALPDIATQRAIVAEIEAEQALVAANRELITRMEAKIRAVMDRVWGKNVENSG